ncbi:MAG: EAL domain-containing protein [Moraxellaceae bacterium]|nr:EAL domain-containing protein [Moraxellaceae bacterium]
MTNNNILNLLVIDNNQVYAEHLVQLLTNYYDKVNLGFLDDKEEFIKTLIRKQWDVVVYGHAYDMQLTDVLNIIEKQEIDLPVISLLNEETAEDGQNQQGVAKVINDTLIKAIPAEKEQQIILAIILYQQATARLRTIRELRYIINESEQRANILINNSKSAVAYVDIEQGTHIFANEPYLKIFGYQSMDDLMKVAFIDLFSSGEGVQEFKQFLKHFEKGHREQVEFKFESKRADNSTFSAKLQLASATYEGQPVTQVIIQQDTGLEGNSAEFAQKLAQLQRTDSLTGLENRQGFMEHLAKVRGVVKTKKQPAGLMYVHLDNLGKINGALGIQGIDDTVKQVAENLQEFFNNDYVSRFSDSVFTIIIEDINKDQLQMLAKNICQRVDNLLIEVGKRTADTSLSIGLVMIAENSPNVDTILARAVDAYNQVMIDTNNKGNAYYLYDPSHYINNDNEALAEYLVTALNQNNFALFYQPIYDIDLDSSSIFEVYTSLKLSDGKIMPYSEFADVAKANNLLIKIDRWILINACRELIKVRANYPEASIIVNLSCQMLINEQLPRFVEQLIEAFKGDTNAFILQFDEKDIINYLAVAKKQFASLAKLNCQVSMRSFGATAKSLEIVEFVKPNIVRLNRNYVVNLNDSDEFAEVKQLISTMNENKINVLMPYIEDASTMSIAWSVGARYLQGYYLQAPANEMTFA